MSHTTEPMTKAMQGMIPFVIDWLVAIGSQKRHHKHGFLQLPAVEEHAPTHLRAFHK